MIIDDPQCIVSRMGIDLFRLVHTKECDSPKNSVKV